MCTCETTESFGWLLKQLVESCCGVRDEYRPSSGTVKYKYMSSDSRSHRQLLARNSCAGSPKNLQNKSTPLAISISGKCCKTQQIHCSRNHEASMYQTAGENFSYIWLLFSAEVKPSRNDDTASIY